MDDYKFMAAVDYVVQGDFLNAAKVFESDVDHDMVKLIDIITVLDKSATSASVCADLIGVLAEARGESIEATGEKVYLEGLIALFVVLAKKAAEC